MSSNQENESNKVSISTKWANWVLDHRWLSSFVSIVLLLATAYGAQFLSMSSDYRYYFGKDNSQRLAFEKIQRVYSNDDSVLIAVKSKTGNVFNKETLAALVDLTQKGWQVPYSTRVDSITNFQHSSASEDDLIVKDLVLEEELETLDAEKLKALQEIALNEPLIANILVSEDASITGVNIRVNLPGNSPMEVPEVAAYARQMVEQFNKDHPGHETYITGIAMLNNAFNEAGMHDMMTLTPLMYLIIIVIMFALLRSVSAVLSTLVVIMMSVLSGMGLGGWLGIPITPPSSIASTVIVTLAIADSIHLLKAFLELLRAGKSKRDALVEAMELNLLPIFLTSFTTAVGFLTLNFSDTPPFHDLGNITAMGVIAAYVYSILILPVLISVLPFRVKKEKVLSDEEQRGETFLSRLGLWAVRHRVAVIVLSLVGTTFFGYQISRIVLNDQFVQYFDKSIPFRVDTETVMKELTGIYRISYELKSGESQGMARPDFLQKVGEFTDFMRSVPGVTHVSSITDTFKRLNKNMHGDDPNYYKLPEQRELAAQYLLLYEMSLPYGLDLNNRIDVDKSATRVVVTMGDLQTQEMLAIAAKGENWLKKNAPPEMHALGSSPAIMFSHISKRNVQDMMWGTLVAFIIITLTLIFAIGSLKYGLISLIPNMIPAVIGFGIWGLLVGEAGFAIAIVGSVTLGIVVDDTVHFLSKYVRARREKGMSTDQAIQYAFLHVGPALVTTTVVLVAGFSVLMLSAFKMNYVLGALSALTIGIALFIDFLLLPAVLAVVDRSELAIRGVKMKTAVGTTVLLGGVLLAFASFDQAQAEDMNAKGLRIAQQVDERDNGFVDQVAQVKMVLTNAHGQVSERDMRIKTLEVSGDGDKSLTIFDRPRDVKGTAFLSFSHSTVPDDQWLYLPALRRVKRISSNNKSGPFMGSEFAYEDISSQEVDKYTYKYIREETVDGKKGHVIERYPIDKRSGYTRQIAWVDEAEWRLHKVEFYDRKNTLLKTLTYKGYKKYPNNKWRPDEMHMVNHQTKKQTKLLWSEYKFNQKLNSRDFDKNALKRVR